MALSVKHTFQSIKADGADTTLVQPSNWNAEHAMIMATGKVLGRMTAASGAVEELPLIVDATGQTLRFPQGTTAQRPTPVAGMVRFNTTLGVLEAYQNGAWGNFADIDLSAQGDATVLGRALGAGTGTPVAVTQAQLQRMIYNVGNAYPTFNSAADNGFLFGFGQNISRTTYSALFAKFGTRYGAGDGSTTFGMPDVRGRVLAGVDNMGGTSADRLIGAWGGLNGDVLGGVGGIEYHVMTIAQMPAHQHYGDTGTESADHIHSYPGPATVSANGGNRPSGSGGSGNNLGTTGRSAAHYHSFTTQNTGGGGAINIVQPTITVNWQIYTGVHT
jgi:microcystin-dependent protein